MARKTEGARRVRAIAQALVDGVDAMSSKEMEQALIHIAGMTTGNCWWVEYQVRGVLRELIVDHQKWRARAAPQPTQEDRGER